MARGGVAEGLRFVRAAGLPRDDAYWAGALTVWDIVMGAASEGAEDGAAAELEAAQAELLAAGERLQRTYGRAGGDGA